MGPSKTLCRPAACQWMTLVRAQEREAQRKSESRKNYAAKLSSVSVAKRLGKTVAQFRKVRELRCEFVREPAPIETPAPISAMQAGSIHTGLAAQSEHVLQWSNTQACGRA